jgi:hypothetical protein
MALPLGCDALAAGFGAYERRVMVLPSNGDVFAARCEALTIAVTLVIGESCRCSSAVMLCDEL